jgi:tetratricopeptide (TPR) repeat protein
LHIKRHSEGSASQHSVPTETTELKPLPDTARPRSLADFLGRCIDDGFVPPEVQLDAAPGAEPHDAALWWLAHAERLGRSGRLEEAVTAIEQARNHLANLAPAALASVEVALRLALVEGRLALRTGRAPELRGQLRNGRRQLRQLASPPRSLSLAWLELESMARIARSNWPAARRLLAEAVALAVGPEARWAPRFHRLVGAIHARRGYPLLAMHAYQRALVDLDVAREPLEVARVSSNLAMTALMCGRIDEAHAAIDHALALRHQHGASLAERANSTAVAALITERRAPELSGDAWARAVELARASGEHVLAAEIEMRAAMSAIGRHQPDAARSLLESAEHRIHQAAQVEPTIAAMAAETRARLALLCQEHPEAERAAMAAARAYRDLDAVFHIARVELLRGRIAAARDDESTAARHLGRACAAALRGCFEVAVTPDERLLVQQLSMAGSRSLRQYGKVFGLGQDAARVVLLFDESGTIEAFGACHELGTRSVLYRLARTLVASDGRGRPASLLVARLWPLESDLTKGLNRLRVHVHRLRGLLGREHDCVQTFATHPDGTPEAWYRWNPACPVRVIRPARGRRPRPV